MKAPFISKSRIRVRYQETDQMRIVYHTNYLVWFEVGRTDYIRHFGYSYRQLEEQGLFLPVVDLSCRYLQPARYEDDVEIYTQIKELKASKLVFEYEAKLAESGELLAKGTTTHLWTNTAMKRINLQKDYPDIYHKLSR